MSISPLLISRRSTPRSTGLAVLATAAALGVSALAAACAPGDVADGTSEIRLPNWSEQTTLREGWLERRHDMLLPMMRQYDIDMWIVVNEEFHDDPMTEYIAPSRPYTGNRDIFVFVDTGEGLRRVAITGYSEVNLKRFFERLVCCPELCIAQSRAHAHQDDRLFVITQVDADLLESTRRDKGRDGVADRA